jgi:hypothetical protein
MFLGHDGHVPEAGWFPIVFEIQNDGPSFNGVVELRAAHFGEGQTRRVPLELPTGTLKRFVVPVFSSTRYVQSWDARLLDERGKVRAEQPDVRPRRHTQWFLPTLGALSSGVGRMPVIPTLSASKTESVEPAVARLQPSLFPDHPLALEGLSAIYLHSDKALELNASQAHALLAWLFAGGHLIIGVEQLVHLSGNPWLKPLLPADFTGMQTVASHAALLEWLRSSRGADGSEIALHMPEETTPPFVRPPGRRAAPATPATPILSAPSPQNPYASLAEDPDFAREPLQVAAGPLRDGQVLIGPPETPLALMAPRGRGQITVLTFNPEMRPFLSWKLRPHFWYKLAGFPAELLVTERYNRWATYSPDGVMGAMIDSRQVRKLPVAALLLLLVGYLVVIGPFDQWWLKKINRQMLTWITFPMYVAAFSGLIYLIGYKLRAGVTEYNELQIVDLMPRGEQADLRGRSYGSIYSPANARYKLASEEPYATLRGEHLRSQHRAGEDSARIQVEQRGHSFVAEVAVPVWSSQLYVSEWWRRGPPPVRFTVEGDRDRPRLRVENHLDHKLTHLRAVVRRRILELGELGPRQTATFEIDQVPDEPLAQFVNQQAGQFEQAVQRRQQAFGESGWITDVPNATAAISFLGQRRPTPRTGPHQQFLTPPGLDLSEEVRDDQAILLAFAPGLALAKPLNQFTPRRSHHNTVLRVVAPLK